MVIGLPSLKMSTGVCTTCLIGKQHQTTIPKQISWRASNKIQLVHADICGPISPTSNSCKRYILSFVDDYSRKTWIYFLHDKSETFNAFKRFKAYVEKEVGTYIVYLRTDRGGEFTSKAFSEFCDQQGISRQLTAAYTLQQNEVAERKNRTIMNAIRAVLHEKQVPKTFYPEVVKWYVHIQNRSPTTTVEYKTPEEVWCGIKPHVNYFCIFGCIAHVHFPNQRRRKLDDKSQQCVLLGVSDETKGYKPFDPITKKVIDSRDVVFEEDKHWNWNENKTESTPTALDVKDQDEGVALDSEHTDPPDEGRVTRTQRQPAWLTDYETNLFVEEEDNLLAMMTTEDPNTFEEANASQKWREAMDAEMKAIEKNDTWELVDPPNRVIPIGVKWVFKTKLNEKGHIEKYKARLVARGYAQTYCRHPISSGGIQTTR
uniref:Retrovirus-related Pol polyprotein from transposon TNT 1-94 n=1 Tax=Cajanus cajan TaxID=3821 RepID=A0A151S361_CAJCA|nr:Retrovirus-related Pol polyprotein from transposon TNT 1-94 [Cajanus cajan]